MFQTLYTVYSRLRRPSKLVWLNMWAYSRMNSWTFISTELLTFYIESLNGLKLTSLVQRPAHLALVYGTLLSALLVCGTGLFIG